MIVSIEETARIQVFLMCCYEWRLRQTLSSGVRLPDRGEKRTKEGLGGFKGRRLFVGVARVERFSEVGWSVVALLSERRCDKWRREPRRQDPENVEEY